MKRETRWIERGRSVICSFHDRNGRLVKAISPNVYAAHGAGFAYTFDAVDVIDGKCRAIDFLGKAFFGVIWKMARFFQKYCSINYFNYVYT